MWVGLLSKVSGHGWASLLLRTPNTCQRRPWQDSEDLDGYCGSSAKVACGAHVRGHRGSAADGLGGSLVVVMKGAELSLGADSLLVVPQVQFPHLKPPCLF